MEHGRHNVYLVGARCTGKTTVGRMLAARLDLEFFDADAELVRRAGQSVSEIVAQGGWPAFRALEKQVLADLCARNGLVVATGGGAVLDPENVAALRAAGFVVWLTATPGAIAARMEADAATGGQRPSLTGQGVLEEIREVLDTRAPLYAGAAHAAVDTMGRDAGQVCGEVCRVLEKGE